MKKKEKKEWLIKYIKKHSLDEILADKYKKNKKCSIIRKYSNEIQSICSIISVLFIGMASLYLSTQQNTIMRSQYKPIITISTRQGNNTATLDIINSGTEALSYDIEVYSFIDVQCLENYLGEIPVRVYFFNAVKKIEVKNINMRNDGDVVARVKLCKEQHPNIVGLKQDLEAIAEPYSKHDWYFDFCYLIHFRSVDTLGEINNDYFMFADEYVKRVKDKVAKEIIDECDYGIDNRNEDLTYDVMQYNFNLLQPHSEDIFNYILYKIRSMGLYHKYGTTDYVLYGEHEPNIIGSTFEDKLYKWKKLLIYKLFTRWQLGQTYND